MAFQIARARMLYRAADVGIPALAPSGRIATLAASRLYAGILCEIEALNYDVFQRRAHVSTPGRLRALPRIATTFARMSVPVSGSQSFTRAATQMHALVSESPDARPIAEPLAPHSQPLAAPHPEVPSYG
jgi:hypothetical protein